MKTIQQDTAFLRFKNEKGKDYPNWKETRLELVFSERVERGYVDGEMLSVTLTSGVVRARDLNRHDNSPGDKSKYKKVNVNDIAYNSMRMWQGASGVSKYEGIVSPAYTVLSPNTNQHSGFWGFYFKTQGILQSFQRNSQGLTSDTWNLKYSALSKIKLFIPNKEEQQKIASFLSSVDTKIEQLGKKKALMEQYKKGMMQKLFSQEIRFKDEQGNDYPDWEESCIHDICEINPTSGSLPNTFYYIDLESVHKGNFVKQSKVMKINAPSRAQRLLTHLYQNSSNSRYFSLFLPFSKT